MISATSASSTDNILDATTSSTSKAIAESQDRFLKLLVTQMQNQDPLNPMDNAQVTSQMAQLSTVSGIDKLNATLQALSSSMIASQSMQAASMIGHVVMVPGNQMELSNGQAVAALELTQPADSVSVTITDAMGNVVRRLPMGSQSTGSVAVQWDGLNDLGQPVADGTYKFSAKAELGGVESSVSTMSYGLVNSVMQGTQGATLNVAKIGEVNLSSVKQIL